MKWFSNSVTRRDFLEAATILAVAGAFPGCLRSRRPSGSLLSTSLQVAPDGKSTYFSVLDLAKDRCFEMAVPLELGHSVAVDPNANGRAILFESGGGGVCQVDLVSRSVLRVERARDGWLFGGHGGYSRDGKHVFSTQFSPDQGGSGRVSVRDAETLREIAHFPSYGRYPHEMYVVSEGAVIALANLGYGTGALSESVTATFIDIRSQKLLESRPVRQGLPSGVRDEAVLPGEGEHARLPPEMTEEANYYMNMIGALAPDPNRALSAIIHAHDRTVSFWDPRGDRTLRKAISFRPAQPITTTITPDQDFVAIAVSDGRVVMVDRKNLSVRPDLSPQARLRCNTHLTPWKPPA